MTCITVREQSSFVPGTQVVIKALPLMAKHKGLLQLHRRDNADSEGFPKRLMRKRCWEWSKS